MTLPESPHSGGLRGFVYSVAVYFGLSIWTAGLIAATGATVVTFLFLLRGHVWAMVSLAVLVSHHFEFVLL